MPKQTTPKTPQTTFPGAPAPADLSIEALEALLAARKKAEQVPRRQLNVLVPVPFIAWLAKRASAARRWPAQEIVALVKLAIVAEAASVTVPPDYRAPWETGTRPAAGPDAAGA